MQQEIILISDPKVLAIPIRDNDELLVDLRTIPELFVDLSNENFQKKYVGFPFVRKSVAEMLVKAQDLLPKGYKLMIKEGYRDIEIQKKIFNEYLEFLKKEFPNFSKEELYEKASAYVAPPEIIPPHSTGGAIDLTLMTNDDKEIDMGTKFNTDIKESNFSNYTKTIVPKNIEEKRELLTKAMESVGFVNYPTEWWHWSYGDRYWAFIKGKKFALYNSIDIKKGE